MKAINKLLLASFIMILLSAIVYADVITIEAGTQFTPDLANITYTAMTRFTCDELSVDLFCLNITGGDYAGRYCDKSAIPLNYTIEGAYSSSINFDSNRCYGLMGGFIKTSGLLPLIVIVLVMGVILPIIYVFMSGKQDQAMDFISAQGGGLVPLVVGIGVMVIVVILVLVFATTIVNQGCVP